MRVSLKKSEAELVIQSLNYTRRAFENYTYPTYAFKVERIKEVEEVIGKFRKAKSNNH
jgi:hypothetical protein